MKKILFILLSFCLAGEMEIDGDLTVLGSVNAPGLGGMKPERIYFLGSYNSDVIGNYTVPEGKLWAVYVVTESFQLLDSNPQFIEAISYVHNQPIILPPGYTVMIENHNAVLNIFEYPISGSGTDQGMDYVEP